MAVHQPRGPGNVAGDHGFGQQAMFVVGVAVVREAQLKAAVALALFVQTVPDLQ